MNPTAGGEEALRRLQEFGEEYVGVLRDCWRLFGPAASPAELGSVQAEFQKRYQRLFMPTAALPVAGADEGTAILAAIARCGQASERFALQASAIAADACARFAAAIASTDESLPKITTLRELYELWIECGEAAYAAAAHGDDYAMAQAEFMTAHLELRFLQMQAGAT